MSNAVYDRGYFGDEVEMIIDNEEETCWKIYFSSCHKVSYETDANKRKITKVRNMKKSQLGYLGRNISVCESENANFFQQKEQCIVNL